MKNRRAPADETQGQSVSAAAKPEAGDVTTWSEEMRYLFEERAGIKEFDGNTPRHRAEMEARREVWALSQSEEEL